MIELKLSGMSCQHCVKAVTAALQGVAGTTEVVVTLEPPRAQVQGNPSLDAILGALEEEGYAAELLS